MLIFKAGKIKHLKERYTRLALDKNAHKTLHIKREFHLEDSRFDLAQFQFYFKRIELDLKSVKFDWKGVDV